MLGTCTLLLQARPAPGKRFSPDVAASRRGRPGEALCSPISVTLSNDKTADHSHHTFVGQNWLLVSDLMHNWKIWRSTLRHSSGL